MPTNNSLKKEPIKVLQMISSLYFGGSQTMIMNLYKHVDNERVQFDFVVDHPEYNDLKPIIDKLGGTVYTMPAFKGANILEIKKAWNNFFSEHPEYKILHSHTRSYASLYIPIAKKHGVKTIIHSHNTSNGKSSLAPIKAMMQYPLRYLAGYYIGCSLPAGEWLFGEKVTKSAKFFVLNNAIEANKFRFNNEVRKQYRKDFKVENKTVYIQVGSFGEQKNHEFTINMFAELLKIKNDAILFLVGDGEYKENIIKQIDRLNIKDYVVLLGRRNDVDCLLQMADCYLMPSVFEGLSVAAIEAQASGIKCLLSNTVTKDVKVSEVVEFLPLDIQTWVNRCNQSFDRVDTYNQIIDSGYDINSTANWLMDFYEDIVNE